MRWLFTAAAVLPLLGLLFAAGHGHDLAQGDEEHCADCHLQQAKWLPEIGTPELALDSASQSRSTATHERIARDSRHLLEPLRGPPTPA
ncbi:MAG: hypothetical protein AAF604_01750 [Acidobacteriota bacterium]